MDIPKQEKQETVPAFVLRACAIMEKTQKSGEGVKTSAKLAEEAQDRRERIERLESKRLHLSFVTSSPRSRLFYDEWFMDGILYINFPFPSAMTSPVDG